MTRRSLASGAIGARAAARAPEGFFATVHEAMRAPGWKEAMLSHIRLAMRSAGSGRRTSSPTPNWAPSRCRC